MAPIPFLPFRKPNIEPLPVSMTGVRMGEKLLQIGIDDAALLGAMTAKVGLSGHAVVVVADEDAAGRANAAMVEAGTLADVHVTPLTTLPIESALFDVAVIHAVRRPLGGMDAALRDAMLREILRAMRIGGRVIAIEAGTRTGLKAMLSSGPVVNDAYQQAGGTVAALQQAGFRPVRLLADRDGLTFIEGLKT